MKHITEMQNSNQVVHTIPEADAVKLITEGYVRQATIDPAPKDGMAVNLTAKGRGYKASGKSAPVADTATRTISTSTPTPAS